MTTTTISHLPRDMAEEILSRVPLRFMRAVRLTCKKWDTLSKNRSFTKMHTAMEGNRMMIVLMDYKLYLTSAFVKGTDFEPLGKLTFLNDDSEQVINIYQVFHCEGLLLCLLKDTSKIVVWNPYWGQTRWIEPRYSYRDHRYRYALGYSKNNKSLGSYKILRFIDDYLCKPERKHHFSWYEIYNLDTGLWKTLDVKSPHWLIFSDSLGVSLKGNTYWIASKPSRACNDYLICFDFTRERFGRLLPLPLPGGEERLGQEISTLSCVKEEKLAVLYQYDDAPPMVDIWITTKIEADEVLWSKFFTVNMETVAHTPISFNYGDFYFDEDKRLAMVFDDVRDVYRHTVNIVGMDGYYREVDLAEDGYSKLDVRASKEDYGCRTTMCSYVSSLVQIKKLSRGCKRKKQSSLEKHRCHQKVLRLAAIGKRIKHKEQEHKLQS